MTIRNHPVFAPLCPLAAREAELNALLRCWRSSRLVTLFGQSGSGKSVLAQAAAAALAAETLERVSVVDASRAGRGTTLLRLLARQRRRTTDRLPAGTLPDGRGTLPPSAFYLLMDDLPVSAHGAARGVLQWLVAHPEAHLLVVSRWPLELLGEQVVPLPPLALEGAGGITSPAATFLEHCAGRARPGGSSPEPALGSELCRALDGLPAALEAAAGLLGTLPAAEITRIAREEPLALMLRGQRLEAMVAATWSDLPAAARDTLAAHAGWAGRAAEERHQDRPVTGANAEVTARLLQIGLLRQEATGPRPCYRLAPLVAAWIDETGAAHAPARQEHRARALLREVEHEPGSPPSLPALCWAWRWVAGQRDADAVIRFARAAAGPLWQQWGEPGEARELLGSALKAARAVGREDVAALKAELAAAEAAAGEPLEPAEAEAAEGGRSREPLASNPPHRVCAPTAPLLIRLLGPFTVEGPGGILALARLRPKEQRILARLALEPRQVVPRDELLELFWGQSSVRGAERSLRTVVSSLRAALRSVLAGQVVKAIRGRLEGYCLEGDACVVDADLFEQAVQTARAAASEGLAEEAALTAWRQAYEWYRGDLLGAFMYEDWCLTARERLRDQFLDALFQLARAALAHGSPEEARGLAARMIEIDATEERAHRLLMRSYAVLQRPAEALRQFERCRAALSHELGAHPAAATVSLLEAIRAGGMAAEPEGLENAAPARA